MLTIDCHTHLFKTREHAVEELLHLMDETGIDKAIVFPGTEINPDNEFLSKAIAAHRDRLYPFAWINPVIDSDKRQQELRRLVEKDGFKGMKLHPLFHSFYPNRPNIYPLVQLCGELGIPVTVHSGHAPYSLPWQIAELAKACPDTTVIMDHMGLQVGWVDDAILLAEHIPNIVLGTTAMPFHEKIRIAVERVGENRVIFGSDAPSIHPFPELSRVRLAGLSEQSLAAVVGKNTARLLGI
jgi:predicted TIM-barrel fold metal-dependent hydrolase